MKTGIYAAHAVKGLDLQPQGPSMMDVVFRRQIPTPLDGSRKIIHKGHRPLRQPDRYSNEAEKDQFNID